MIFYLLILLFILLNFKTKEHYTDNTFNKCLDNTCFNSHLNKCIRWCDEQYQHRRENKCLSWYFNRDECKLKCMYDSDKYKHILKNNVNMWKEYGDNFNHMLLF